MNKILIIIIIFILGLVFSLINKPENIIEKFTNKRKYRCPNILIQKDSGFRSGVYIYKGVLTSEVLGKVFDLKYKNIELLMM